MQSFRQRRHSEALQRFDAARPPPRQWQHVSNQSGDVTRWQISRLVSKLFPTMPTSLEKLQSLLRELFQFELSDLDFGIYRLLRLKRDELDKFLSHQIPQSVEKAFDDL